MAIKFSYGYDIEVYMEKALEELKKLYPWANRSQFNKQRRFAIELEKGEYHFIRYTDFGEGDIKREVLDVRPPSYKPIHTAADIIREIVCANEYEVMHAIKVVKTYSVPFEQGRMADKHWYLEHYDFKRMDSGDYFVFVQAGNGGTGGGRDFYIPREYFKGSYKNFLDKYTKLVPGDSFGLYREDLEKDQKLKAFLGF